MNFKLVSDFKPKGSQPGAINKLLEGFKKGKKFQTLLGVTGSGKTFTVANVVAKLNVPVLVLSHNKTLASQLYDELREFFPENRVEYFVSYYDYYRPESYVPQKDQYIEKDSQVNAKIEQMRLSATASLLSRSDTIVVSSISCIYGLGNPENFQKLGFELKIGQKIKRNEILKKLVSIQFERNDSELMPGRFRVKGDVIDVIPGYFEDVIRIEMFGDEIERILEVNKTTGDANEEFKYFFFYPAKHFVMPERVKSDAIKKIHEELEATLPNLEMLEANRLKQRTEYDVEMIEETGRCKGIENYSAHFENRKRGEKPFCLLDYFPEEFLFVIDESHQTLPQARAMHNGDYARKKPLVDYGFRLPSAFDNRPLKFSEFEKYLKKTLFVSATPSDYELKKSEQVVEQIVRPTGLLDPVVEVKSTKGQVKDVLFQIKQTIKRKDRILITTLTKKLAEELAEYLSEKGIKTRYLHSDIDTLERNEIIRELRLGKFDVLVGINLLREGLDIPEVGFIGIFDADKEGFLRDARSLIQIIGRAARNANSKVIMYADAHTRSMNEALSETLRRRNLQMAYNKKHGIRPKTVVKPIRDKEVEIKDAKHVPKKEIPNLIVELQTQMREAAENLNFEEAIMIRNKIKKLNERIKK